MGTATAGFAGSPNSLLFSQAGQTVVSANLDGSVTLWDAGSATLRESCGTRTLVAHLVFGSDGKTLYTVSGDGTAIAWDLTGNQEASGGRSRSTHDRDFDEQDDYHPGGSAPTPV